MYVLFRLSGPMILAISTVAKSKTKQRCMYTASNSDADYRDLSYWSTLIDDLHAMRTAP